MGHKISKEQIDPGVKDHIMSFVGDISELETEVNTDIISAVNSLMVDRVDNAENMGKLANVIGEPVTANHSVDEVVEGLGEMLSTFKTNMMNSGVMVESSDKFKQLIDKIRGLTEGEGNKGIQFAEGIVTSSSTTQSYLLKSSSTATTTVEAYTLKVDNLLFKPVIVIIKRGDGGLVATADTFSNKAFVYITTNGMSYDAYRVNFNLTYNDTSAYKPIYINDTGFELFTTSKKTEFSYYVFGVGEEDTTLRDSLASILEEEGVEVTEEDDMASLISKVDEEFTKDNEIINNAKDKLYNFMTEGGYEVNNDMSLEGLLELLEQNGVDTSGIKQIACGDYMTAILRKDGTVWACGSNYRGALGIGTSDTSAHTNLVNVITYVEKIACGGGSIFVIKKDGSLWCCGNNSVGQLGLNDKSDRTTFTPVTTNVKQVACGHCFTFIIKNDDSLWACGYNNAGQLGLGDKSDRTTFTQVTTNVKQVACGFEHTFILKNDGTVWATGDNTVGGLGLNNTTNKTTFTQVTTNISDIKHIACGYYHTFIVKNDGSLWATGNNSEGQLGLGTSGSSTYKTTFTHVTTNVNYVDCGFCYSMIIKNNGTLWACGGNNYGELGLGDISKRTSFTQVTLNIGNNISQVSCSEYDLDMIANFTVISDKEGNIFATGVNTNGQLGLGNTTNMRSFTKLSRGF